MVNVSGEVEIDIECTCPKCRHKWIKTEVVYYEDDVDIDLSEFASSYNEGRD